MTKKAGNCIVSRTKANPLITTSLAYVFAAVVSKGISFISTPFFTRMMGTEDFGIVSNFATWSQLMSAFICLQVTSGLLSAKVNRAKKRFDSYIKSVLCASTVFAVFFSLIVYLLRKQIALFIEIDESYIFILCIYAFGLCLSHLFLSYCIACARPTLKIAFSVVSSFGVVFAGILSVLIFSNKSEGRIYGYGLTYFLIAGFIIIYLSKKGNLNSKEFIGDIKFALSFGVPLIPHLIANIINGNADRIFIIKLIGESGAGIYSVAYNIGVIVLILADACNDAWVPWYYMKSKANAGKEISKYFKIYTITIAMCFLGVMMLAPEIMKIMASQEFWTGTSCIPYIALGVFFLFLYRFPLNYEQLKAKTKYIAVATVLTSLINIFLNSRLIPVMGISGAAFATMISYLVLWIFHEAVARKAVKAYDIRIVNYIPAICIVLTGFMLSQLTESLYLVRYMIVLFCCSLYLLYILRKIKNDNIFKSC